VVSRTSICCAYHVNSPFRGDITGTHPVFRSTVCAISCEALCEGGFRGHALKRA
jgi:hypothetical protein